MSENNDLTDETIVAKVIAGDVDLYGELMLRYEQKLLRYVVYLTGHQISAADVVQETFIKAYRNLRGFNAKYKFSSWVYRIAHNEAMNAIKKDRHINHEVEIESLNNSADTQDLGYEIDKTIMNKQLQACIDQLDTKYRDILILQYFEDMKYAQISDVLQIPISTVGVRSARAKAKLKEICNQMGVKYE